MVTRPLDGFGHRTTNVKRYYQHAVKGFIMTKNNLFNFQSSCTVAFFFILFSTPAQSSEPYGLKGDLMGMSLTEFRQKHHREFPATVTYKGSTIIAPWCSDTRKDQNSLALVSKDWYFDAGLINCRLDYPFEDKTTTIGGVAQSKVIYQFVDEKLFMIVSEFSTVDFEKVSAAFSAKYGSPKTDAVKVYQNRFGANFTGVVTEWDNGVSFITLTETDGKIGSSTVVIGDSKLIFVAGARKPVAQTDDL